MAGSCPQHSSCYSSAAVSCSSAASALAGAPLVWFEHEDLRHLLLCACVGESFSWGKSSSLQTWGQAAAGGRHREAQELVNCLASLWVEAGSPAEPWAEGPWEGAASLRVLHRVLGRFPGADSTIWP